MGVVHLDSAGDQLARGMSWPIGLSAIVDALSRRAEPEVWLTAWRTDTVKHWARDPWREGRGRRVSLLELRYTEDRVRQQADWEKKKFRTLQRAAWFGLDDPPLLWVSVHSLPAPLMRAAKLTRARTAEVLTSALGPFPRGSLTQKDWQIELVLECDDRQLSVYASERPVRKWAVVRAMVVQLED